MLPDFKSTFQQLTGTPPFPWQEALYDEFVNGRFPSSANIPTGLGKTSVVVIWLIVLLTHPDKVARRLVYVVNRRTVVDQTTEEVKRIRKQLAANQDLADKLKSLCAVPVDMPLALSTLRGQFADNQEWALDPARPAVIVGTVDMIGSGLLFSRYTVGFKTRPHHAALLGQDVLLVHDEAHLEPAFQKLLKSIVDAQTASADPRKLRVMQLTATKRAAENDTPFTLTVADHENEVVKQRIHAVKNFSLVALTAGEKLDEKIIALAKAKATSSNGARAILIFVRTVEIALKIAAALDKNEHKNKVATLTGTMRGKERDELVSGNRAPARVFQRFLSEKDRVPGVEPTSGTVFLVATSAGEVGVNISADDLICDLSTYESMAQRFGRVNRFGANDNSTITVVHETEFPDKPLDQARQRTLALLQKLDTSANSAALEKLPATEREAAFSPEPDMRVATDIQFDAWALTSIREPIAARPPVAPYLHGEAEWQPPQTQIAWRKELDVLNKAELRGAYPPDDLLEDFPLKPHELLRDATKRIVKTLAQILEKKEINEDTPKPWLLNADGTTRPFSLVNFDPEAAEDLLANATLILPASFGGLSPQGFFSAASSNTADTTTADVSEIEGIRIRVPSIAPKIPTQYAADYRLLRVIDTELGSEALPSEEDGTVDDANDTENGATGNSRYWLWLEAKKASASERRFSTGKPETLAAHTAAVVGHARAIAEKLLSAPADGQPDLRRCLILAAKLHDLGKNRRQWQLGIGNTEYDPANPETIFAKSGGSMRPRLLAEHYRHEFGSLADIIALTDIEPSIAAEFAALSALERDIVLHLVAAHHGRARPHFSPAEILDYSPSTSPESASSLTTETPRRFARLQHHFGRWGLVWLESLLRAADYAASAGIAPQNVPVTEPQTQALNDATKPHSEKYLSPAATISLRLNPANPGHYFACCGLFELAAALVPDALAWFAEDGSTFHIAATGLTLKELLTKITSAEIASADKSEEDDTNDEDDSDEKEASAPPLIIGAPFNLRLDWWITASTKSSALKVWAGSMKVLGIARSMSYTIAHSLGSSHALENILFDTLVAYDPSKIEKNKQAFDAAYEKALKKADEKRTESLKKAGDTKSGDKLEKEKSKITKKFEEYLLKAKLKRNSADPLKDAKKEPFYFDANRGPNSDARDVGFSANDLGLETIAAPAAEFLTLAGLQRAIPQPSGDRLFDYRLWKTPVPIALLAAAINGIAEPHPQPSFRFESWYRTSQRKHKAFLPAKTL